jgi:CBS domain containing-hemolysin-like protein
VDEKLFVVALSLFLSFLFSASETALTSLGRLEIETLIARGGWRARIIQVWVRDPSRILVTILIGNNMSNVAGSSLWALWVNERYHGEYSNLVLVAAFGLFMIFFSEIVPKLLARATALQTAPVAMRFLAVVDFVLRPVAWSLQKASTGVVFLSGRVGREHRKPIGEEELTHTIEIATKEGGIDRETGEVLSNLIDFPDRLARDVMTPRSKVQALKVGWSLDEVVRFIAADGHSRYPVVRNGLDELVGVVLVKDLLNHLQRGSQGLWTRVVRRPYFVSELAPLGNILRDMRRWGTHMALVRNETGILTGLLTMEDLIEEIVGDIRDEHDEPSEGGGDRAMGGPKLVNGEIPIVDFNDRYNASLPLDVSYSTLNGYLLSKTGGEIPPLGTMIFAEDVTFRVHSVSENGIATVEIIEHARGHGE